MALNNTGLYGNVSDVPGVSLALLMLAFSHALSHFYSVFTHSLLTCVLSVGYS